MPVGEPLPDWQPPPPPARESIEGRYCRLEPLDAALHAEALYTANSLDTTGRSWVYMPYGPFSSLEHYRDWMASVCSSDDPLFFAICRMPDEQPVGVASYLRIHPEHGTIEVGHIHYSPLLQRTAAATEAMFLMMRRAFESGYRRYEWKCDALNRASRSAALRLGFAFEGVFRQATVYKGRNRDTAWYSIIDREWPVLQQAYQAWLDPNNFDNQGCQRQRLADCMREGHSPQMP